MILGKRRKISIGHLGEKKYLCITKNLIMDWYFLLGVVLCVIGLVWHFLSPDWSSVEHTYRTNLSLTLEYLCVPMGFACLIAPHISVYDFPSLGRFFLYLIIGLVIDMVIRFAINKIKLHRRINRKKDTEGKK